MRLATGNFGVALWVMAEHGRCAHTFCGMAAGAAVVALRSISAAYGWLNVRFELIDWPLPKACAHTACTALGPCISKLCKGVAFKQLAKAWISLKVCRLLKMVAPLDTVLERMYIGLPWFSKVNLWGADHGSSDYHLDSLGCCSLLVRY